MKNPPDETAPLLFDVNIDPQERNNLATSNPKLGVRLAQKIAQWWPITERKVLGLEWGESMSFCYRLTYRFCFKVCLDWKGIVASVYLWVDFHFWFCNR